MPRLNVTGLEYGHSHKGSLILHMTSLEGCPHTAVIGSDVGVW